MQIIKKLLYYIIVKMKIDIKINLLKLCFKFI